MAASALASIAVAPVAGAAAAIRPTKASPKHTACSNVLGNESVTGPTRTSAWRVELDARIGVYAQVPGKKLHPTQTVAPTDAPWLLVLAQPRSYLGRCWLLVRLPWRPNSAAGWVNANGVFVEKTVWRIEVSRARRTLTLFKSGRSVRTISVVVGKPSTPTPTGLFAIAWAIPWYPNQFDGSWVLELTAHSNVLHQFEGGDGTIGIHGRGGASLLNPLGSAASHGCVRLANSSIDWLVDTVGENTLPGTPVEIS